MSSLKTALFACVMASTSHAQAQVVVDFETMALGKNPDGMSVVQPLVGKAAVWQVSNEPSGNKIVTQLGDDKTDNRFPILILDSVSARNVEISVRFRTTAGSVDQAAGLIWRYVDARNYYVVRANALEDNIVHYKVQNGVRTDLPVVGKGRSYGAVAKVPPLQWHTMSVLAIDDTVTISFNGSELFKGVDTTFQKAGKVGLWTKADSITQFDDLKVTSKD